MNEEATNFNLFDLDGDLAHQSSCARIPQVDLLGPLGGEGETIKGETIKGNDVVMCFVLKDLYGKIREKGVATLLDKGNVLSIS